jgi:hypothetical protein
VLAPDAERELWAVIDNSVATFIEGFFRAPGPGLGATYGEGIAPGGEPPARLASVIAMALR